MSDINFRDSKYRWHQICIQEFLTSCGPASVAMVERIYKHLQRSDEPRARAISQKYPGRWTIEGGAYMNNLSSVLNTEGVKAYKETYVGPAKIRSYLRYYASFSTPVIVHVEWGGTSAMGHFVVCAIADTDNTFVFYDPWYGIIEIAGSDLPKYRVSDSTGVLTSWLVMTYH